MFEARKISAEVAVELQRLFSDLPSAIAEAVRTGPVAEGSLNTSTDGDERADTIIWRIVQLTQKSEVSQAVAALRRRRALAAPSRRRSRAASGS